MCYLVYQQKIKIKKVLLRGYYYNNFYIWIWKLLNHKCGVFSFINFLDFTIKQIEVGDVICEIETDKATLEFECLEEG